MHLTKSSFSDKNPDIIPIEGKISDSCSNKSSATDYSSIRPLLSKDSEKYETKYERHFDITDPRNIQIRPMYNVQMPIHNVPMQGLPNVMPNVGPNECRPYDKVYENWLKYKNSLPLNTGNLVSILILSK